MPEARPVPWSWMRVVRAAGRRAGLWRARLVHRGVSWGAGCDVRRRLVLVRHAGARIGIGANCVLDRDLTIECGGELTIGARTIFGHHCTLGVHQRVVIGPDCLIADQVSIRDHDHRFDRLDVPMREQGMSVGPVTIGRDVWLGSKVTVAKGVTIGDHAVIGANAVVTRDIPPRAIAAGVPARVLRYRGEAGRPAETPAREGAVNEAPAA